MTPYLNEQLGCEGSMSQHDTLTLEPGSARHFIEWCKAQPEDREPTTLESALAEFEASLSATQPAQAAQAEPKRPHVGDSKFESWYQAHPKANGGDKQLARDAYAAGMSDPAAAQAVQSDPTLRERAEALVQAGHAFWKACLHEAGGGAVRWLSCDDGTLIVFTRGEYRHQIMSVVSGDAAPTTVFKDDGIEAAQPDPVKPLFASRIAARKWAELQEGGARMQSIAFDGHKSGQPGTIDPWGVVRWGQAAQGAGEVVASIIAEWRDVILNARHNMDGVLDNDQINEVLNVWDDMAIEVERTLGTAVPSNAQAQLRAVEKLIDGSQPIDIPGALSVIRHGGTTPPPAQQPEAVPSEQSGWCVYVAGMVAGWLGMDIDDPKIPTMGAIIERRLWALKRDTPPAQAAADARDAQPMVPLSMLRPIAVEAIRSITGCPDISNGGRHLTDEIDSVARAALATHQQGGE